MEREIKQRLSNVKQRCYNPKRNKYHLYGGRGITICNEWLNNSNSFLKWAIENGYSKELTLDRIDNNKNYSPENCRWVTQKVQQNNRRNTLQITYKGKTKKFQEWCEFLNVPPTRLFDRLYRQNYTIEDAFELPPGNLPKHKKIRLTINV